MSILKQVEGQLLQAGLPRDYVARSIRELRDHEHELGAEEDLNRVKHMGDPDELSEHFITAYRRQSWVGRMPWLSFTVLPIAMTFVTWNLFFLLTLLPVILCNPHMDNYDWATQSMYQTDPGLVFLLNVIYFASKILPFAVATILFLRIAERSGRNRRWSFVAIGIIAAIGLFAFRASFHIPVGPGAHAIGGADFSLEIANFDFENKILHIGEQIAQGVTPLLVGIGFFFFQLQRKQKAQEDSGARELLFRLGTAEGSRA